MRTLARTRFDHDTATAPSAPGRSAAALFALTLAAVFAPAPAHAQDSVPCTAIVDDMARLACYDRALRGTANPPAAPATTAAPSAAEEPRRRERERDVRETAAPAPAAAPAAPAAPTPRTATARPAEVGIVPIVVVGVRALPGRNATFTTEDGQIWVQTDSQTVTFPDVPFAAQIKPGAIGSSFLIPEGRGRAVRVRRGGN